MTERRPRPLLVALAVVTIALVAIILRIWKLRWGLRHGMAFTDELQLWPSYLSAFIPLRPESFLRGDGPAALLYPSVLRLPLGRRRRDRARRGRDPVAERGRVHRALRGEARRGGDGRRSRVRDSIGIAEWDWRYDQSALVTNIRHTLPHHETSTEFHTEGGPFTLVPLPGQRSSLVWVDRPAEAKRRAALAPDALATEIEARAQSILGKVALDGPAQVFPLSGMGVRAFAAQRAVLLGEAAHLFPPIGAQGLNLGYSDVAALGESLAGHPEDPGEASRLAAYDRSRRADIYARTAAVDALNRTLLTGFLPVQAVRGLGLFLLDRIPALRRAVMLRGVGSPAKPPASETDRPAGRRSTGSSASPLP